MAVEHRSQINAAIKQAGEKEADWLNLDRNLCSSLFSVVPFSSLDSNLVYELLHHEVLLTSILTAKMKNN